MAVLQAVSIYAPPLINKCAHDLEHCDSPGEEIIYMKVLAQLLGYDLKVKIVDTLDEMISEVVAGKADVSAFSLTATRLLSENCTQMMFDGFDSYVFLMKGRPSERFQEGMVLQAFQWTVWVGLLLAAFAAWTIDEIRVVWLGISNTKDIGLFLVWLMIALCLSCYGSLVSISAYNANELSLEVPFKTLQDVVNALVHDKCRLAYNDEYGLSFYMDVFGPFLGEEDFEKLNAAMKKRPPLLVETRSKVKSMLETEKECYISFDYNAMIPYFRLQEAKSIVKVITFPELRAQPYYYCVSRHFNKLRILQALAQSSQLWALKDRTTQKMALYFTDEGETLDDQPKIVDKDVSADSSSMTINLAQLSDCFEVLWACYVISLVCLMVERFLKSWEILQRPCLIANSSRE
uniref:Ionotropic glutamate receptor C-terminal domain-containing protein n=1 Tax=Trichuris muris TaxID=70415 RepID=A0A5S6QLS6_TRIMR